MANFRHAYLLLSALLPFTSISFSAQGATESNPPSAYLLNGRALMETRERVPEGDPALAPGIEELRRRADAQMRRKLWSVTDKPFAGPSGDKHDYVSLSSYFWPDPATSTGLPYIHRDGELNPETREYDRTRLEGMCEAVYMLALAHYLTGESRYGDRAVEQIRVWFFNEATKMNPHLRNAQMIKGKNDGNPWGLIETTQLTRVLDGIALLQSTGSWPAEDDTQLRQWFSDYLAWLQTSDLGKGEAAAKNNHGTLYDVQTTVFALYLGRKDLAKEILENAKIRRIAKQIEPDGTQPAELRRTRALTYSELNLTGMIQLALLGEQVGVDLWNYRTDDGRSIRGALDWLLPYATGKSWELKQITRHALEPMVWILRQAAAAYKEPAYEQAIAKIPGVEREILWINLLYPPRASAK